VSDLFNRRLFFALTHEDLYYTHVYHLLNEEISHIIMLTRTNLLSNEFASSLSSTLENDSEYIKKKKLAVYRCTMLVFDDMWLFHGLFNHVFFSSKLNTLQSSSSSLSLFPSINLRINIQTCTYGLFFLFNFSLVIIIIIIIMVKTSCCFPNTQKIFFFLFCHFTHAEQRTFF
jgi:hypothetical protein